MSIITIQMATMCYMFNYMLKLALITGLRPGSAVSCSIEEMQMRWVYPENLLWVLPVLQYLQIKSIKSSSETFNHQKVKFADSSFLQIFKISYTFTPY